MFFSHRTERKKTFLTTRSPFKNLFSFLLSKPFDKKNILFYAKEVPSMFMVPLKYSGRDASLLEQH